MSNHLNLGWASTRDRRLISQARIDDARRRDILNAKHIEALEFLADLEAAERDVRARLDTLLAEQATSATRAEDLRVNVTALRAARNAAQTELNREVSGLDREIAARADTLAGLNIALGEARQGIALWEQRRSTLDALEAAVARRRVDLEAVGGRLRELHGIVAQLLNSW